MLKTFAVIATASALLLGGCNSSTPNISITGIIDDAQKVCSFVPTAESVVAVIAAANPVATTVGAVVNTICDGLKSWQANQVAGGLKAVAPGSKVTYHMVIGGKDVLITGNKV
jgi:hypothetical protein